LELSVPYEGKYTRIHVPLSKENITVLKGQDPSPSKDPEQTVRNALANPIGTKRLSEIVHSGNKVALMFDDFTRPTPTSRIMPIVLEELKKGGVRDQDVVLICGNGMHASEYMTKKRFIQKLGKDIFGRYKVISHNAYDYEKLRFMGVTKSLGTPLFISRYVAEADVKISIGRIAPHIEIGYSGGAKMIMPGVSSIWSIIHNHSGSAPRPGVLENPLRQDIDECGRLVGLDFILNVVCNSRNEILGAFGGDQVKAHRRGVEYGDSEVWGAKMEEKAEILLVSPGLDGEAYFMPSMDCLGVAQLCVKEGGTIIVVASCYLGWDEEEYIESAWQLDKDILKYEYEDLLKMVASRSWREPHHQFQALVYYVQNIVKTCFEKNVVLAGSKSFNERDAKRINLGLHDNIDEALIRTIDNYGGEAKAIVVSNNFTLPLLK